MLAVIDVGTISTRLGVARVDSAGGVDMLERISTITDLGSGVDATGRLDAHAVLRTLDCVRDYGARLALLASRGIPAAQVCVTLTSAARDAANADDILGPLASMGLAPQVVPGLVEARLALLGVVADFPGRTVLMADSGGGSTELAVGRHPAGGTLQVGRAVSLDVGCRRLTERFLTDPSRPGAAADPDAVARARQFASAQFERFFSSTSADEEPAPPDGSALPAPAVGDPGAPQELVCVGGTATSLMAVDRELVPYRSELVHLHRMGADRVAGLARRLLAMTEEQRRVLPGLQPKRAGVIAAGALILDELMRAGGFSSYVASESDSMVGLLACARAALAGETGPLAPLWEPRLTDAAGFVSSCA